MLIRAPLEAERCEAKLSPKEDTRMQLHGNDSTCPNSRSLVVARVLEQGWSVTAAAEAAGVGGARRVWRWLRRWRAEGEAGLLDRSSRPRRGPGQLPAPTVEAIASLRRLRMTAAQIAEVLGLALSTVSAWLQRIRLGKRSRLEPPEPPNRYEGAHPGELVHVDIKQLGRISKRGAGHRVLGHRKSQFRAGHQRRMTGFEYVHVMVDNHSRLAYAEVLPTLTARCAIGFLRRAVAWFADRGVRVQALMSDNGSAYVAHAYRQALAELGYATSASALTALAPTAKQSAHPNAHQRMGLRAHLRQLSRASHLPAALPRPLQLQTPTRLPRPPTARVETDQPRQELQLGRGRAGSRTAAPRTSTVPVSAGLAEPNRWSACRGRYLGNAMLSNTRPFIGELERALPSRPFAVELWDGSRLASTNGGGPTFSVHSPQASPMCCGRPVSSALGARTCRAS